MAVQTASALGFLTAAIVTAGFFGLRSEKPDGEDRKCDQDNACCGDSLPINVHENPNSLPVWKIKSAAKYAKALMKTNCPMAHL